MYEQKLRKLYLDSVKGRGRGNSRMRGEVKNEQ